MRHTYRYKQAFTGGLAICCMLLLTLFILTWLRSQHQTERQRLEARLQRLFNDSYNQCIEQLVRARLAAQAAGAGQAVPDGIIIMSINDNADQQRLQVNVPMPESNSRAERSIVIAGHEPGSKPNEPETRSLMISPGVRATVGNALQPDPVMFQHRFEAAVRREGPGLSVLWGNTPFSGSYIALSAGNRRGIPGAYLQGYQPIVLKALWPQIAFSVLLLLLCGIAFYLSYRTLRRQVRLNAEKDSLISNISHELKTPVATAKVAIEALQHYGALEDREKASEYLQMAAWEMDRLEQLTGQVLNNMQLEAGRMILQRQQLDISGLLADLLRQLKPTFDQRSIRIQALLPDPPVYISGDRIHLQGVFYNVLDNAVKYGGDEIAIRLEEHVDKVLVHIQDNGPGIPHEYREQIFEKFFRVPSGDRHDNRGYGLGLNYTRSVLAAHNGHISQQNGDRGGALFIISLPKQ